MPAIVVLGDVVFRGETTNTTEGNCSRRRASSVPKSVSAETMMRCSCCASKDLIVAGCVKPVVADVRGVVSSRVELLSDDGRECVVNEKLHADAASGSSRSRTASAA